METEVNTAYVNISGHRVFYLMNYEYKTYIYTSRARTPS